jgi:hypothetical protein
MPDYKLFHTTNVSQSDSNQAAYFKRVRFVQSSEVSNATKSLFAMQYLFFATKVQV